MKGLRDLWQPILHVLVAYRIVLSLGIAGATGIVFRSFYVWPTTNTLLHLLWIENPSLYQAALIGYQLFLFTTPFLVSSMLFSLLYVHAYRNALVREAGLLPVYPVASSRRSLFLVVGEIHHALKEAPSPAPQWLILPEGGLYTGIAAIGSIGSGKTQALILPAMRQLFGYRAQSEEEKLSGIVLEVKGDLCRQLQRILKACGREQDYIEVSLDGPVRYNPLHNSLDAYAQAFNIASIIVSIWGKGKEPFWQQSYTDLVRYVILLHRVRDGYVTLVDIFRTVISAGKLEDLLIEVGSRLSSQHYVLVAVEEYDRWRGQLADLRFERHTQLHSYVAPWSVELENRLIENTDIEAAIYRRNSSDRDHGGIWESVDYWYWEHWKFFRQEVKTSIIQGIAVFLSLFETDPAVRRVFCPPKNLYEGRSCLSDPQGVVMSSFEELIEQGKIVGLNFPVALNPALAKTIGTLMKVDYQRAVQLRIPTMDTQPQRHFRPTVFICDEYQNFATVGGDNPTGDERFFSISRQPKCIPIVATQSISSLKEALPNEGVKTLLQAFRTKVFLTTSDPDTARFASELCGKMDRTRISYTVSESSSNANVGWLSGRTASSKGSVSASKQYQKQKQPVFDEKIFFELKNAQSILVAFDGIHPMPATLCYLKPDFLPIQMTWFEQERINFDPRRVRP